MLCSIKLPNVIVALQNRCITEAETESAQGWFESWHVSQNLLPFVLKALEPVVNLKNLSSLYRTLGCPCDDYYLLSNQGKEETRLVLHRSQGLFLAGKHYGFWQGGHTLVPFAPSQLSYCHFLPLGSL